MSAPWAWAARVRAGSVVRWARQWVSTDLHSRHGTKHMPILLRCQLCCLLACCQTRVSLLLPAGALYVGVNLEFARCAAGVCNSWAQCMPGLVQPCNARRWEAAPFMAGHAHVASLSAHAAASCLPLTPRSALLHIMHPQAAAVQQRARGAVPARQCAAPRGAGAAPPGRQRRALRLLPTVLCRAGLRGGCWWGGWVGCGAAGQGCRHLSMRCFVVLAKQAAQSNRSHCTSGAAHASIPALSLSANPSPCLPNPLGRRRCGSALPAAPTR